MLSMTENMTASFILPRETVARLDAVADKLAKLEPFASTGAKPSRSMALRYVLERGLEIVERGAAPKPGGEGSP